MAAGDTNQVRLDWANNSELDLAGYHVYRASDAARKLDDERFARVLQFTKSAFDMAVAFSEPPETAKGAPAPKAAKAG